jgi:hypothetical protein
MHLQLLLAAEDPTPHEILHRITFRPIEPWPLVRPSEKQMLGVGLQYPEDVAIERLELISHRGISDLLCSLRCRIVGQEMQLRSIRVITAQLQILS